MLEKVQFKNISWNKKNYLNFPDTSPAYRLAIPLPL